MKNNLDFTIDNQKLLYEKMKELYWRDLSYNHELDYPDEKYIKFFQENTEYFWKTDVYEECSCKDHVKKDVFVIECYETENVDFVAQQDKAGIEKVFRDGEYFANTCDFVIVVCPLCGEWYGYYMDGNAFSYDEEFGEEWREWVDECY